MGVPGDRQAAKEKPQLNHFLGYWGRGVNHNVLYAQYWNCPAMLFLHDTLWTGE
jgi:hypothetical protein